MTTKKKIYHGHIACGIAGGAKGFNKGQARIGNTEAEFICVGGVDVDPAVIRDFTRHAGVPGTVLDLFTLEQYVKFHGKLPPSDWRQAAPADIAHAFFHRPNIILASFPCKGFSGLLSETRSLTDKYQALNELVLHGMMLCLEAYKDDPVEFYLLENVPRIATRGRHLLDQIEQLLSAYGYASAETTHDCGELGRLAQSRKRFLLVARHVEKVPPFLYEPDKKPLRAVGDVLESMALPGDPVAGPMHRIPQLHWKTWVRLAFVEAGKDWRSLQNLRVADGVLQDFALVPEREYHNGAYGVQRWSEPAGTVTSNGRPAAGSFSVADPRYEGADYASSQYGVTAWGESANTVTSQRSPGQGKFSVADPRMTHSAEYKQLGVREWNKPVGAVSGQSTVGGGAYAVADPRIDGVKHNNCFRVVRWEHVSPSVTGGAGPSAGGLAVSDPRTLGTVYSGYGVADWGKPSRTIAGESFPSNGSFAIADPRVGYGPTSHRNKLAVTGWDCPSKTVTGASQVQGGGLSVADPRPANGWQGGKYRVTEFDEPAGTVIAESGTGNGAFAVSDPRFGDRCWRDGPYGVLPWDVPAGAISGHANMDNGRYSIADPRLPAPTDRLVAVIRSIDNTWHRPFTTLELAALQGLVEPGEQFELDGLSDSAWRERIGNAIPSPAAQAIAGVIGTTLLLAWAGETFVLGSTPIWVRPIAVALSVMQRKPI